MSKENTKKTAEITPEPNLIYTGKVQRWNKLENKIEKVPREAPTLVIDGAKQIKLPGADVQAKGFNLDDAEKNVVFSLFPSDFKQPRKTSDSL